MNRQTWGILSFILIVITALFNFFAQDLFGVPTREGTITVIILTGIAFIFALIGKGIWRILTFIVIAIFIAITLFAYWYVSSAGF